MTLISTGDNVAEVYQQALIDVMTFGQETHPRGFNCKELSPYIIELRHPERNILDDNIRKINKAFAAAEWLWIITGCDDVAFISKFNSRIAQFSDDGETFFGAYGPRFIKQIPQVLKTLTDDPWTRQAIITIWRENPPKTKDVPCTVMLHFMQRPLGFLNLIVYMRSNDIWLGLPYDIHNFTSIQIMVAKMLDLKLGTYTQVDGSLHAYEKDWSVIRTCAEGLTKDSYEETNREVYKQKAMVIGEYLRRKNEQYHNKN
jgi:thymidylate synthase